MTSSIKLIGAINFLAMLLSVPILAAGIWLSTQPDNVCVKLLQWPVIIAGILVLVVALAGFIGGFWRVSWLLSFYLVAMLILIILLAILVASIFIVTNKGSGHPAPNRTYLEYRLSDYSGWLRRKVESPQKWRSIKKCLASTNMCDGLDQVYRLAQDFFKARISPLQSGCCKPPTQCGFTFVNPTYWISPIYTATDMDCLKWSNEQTQLCYSCDSCKAGLLENLKKEWRKVDLVLAGTLVALIAVYLLGCCAFRNAKTQELFSKYKQGYT